MQDPQQQRDVLFPIYGTDISCALEQQPPDTTPLGINVRTFEPQTLRARGGSRPGISQYIPALTAQGAHAIQMLGVIVDPQATALGISFDDSLTPFPYLPDSSNRGRAILGDGSIGWIFAPSDVTTFNKKKKTRGGGGSGFHTSKEYEREFPITNQFAAGESSAQLTGLTITGQLLLFLAFRQSTGGSLSPMTVSDSLGNTYTQAVASEQSVGDGLDVPVGQQEMSIWYCVNNSFGGVTVTASDSTNTYTCIVASILNVAAISPLDAIESDQGVIDPASGGGTIQTGLISASLSTDLLVAFSGSCGSGGGGTSGFPPAGWTSMIGDVAFYKFPSGSANLSYDVISGPAPPPGHTNKIWWNAVGASFKSS